MSRKATSRTRSTVRDRSNVSDEELVDLLGGSSNHRKSKSLDLGGNSATASLNLDHLTSQKLEILSVVPPPSRGRSSSSTASNNYKRFRYGRHMSCTEYCCSYFSMLCYYYPVSCGCLIVILLLTVMVMLASLMWNPVNEYGVIEHDHSNIRSKYDLSMGEIKHWCLGGDNDSCTCEDPLVPVSRVEYKSWVEALKANRRMLKRFQDPSQNIDVAFLGESIIEEIDGRWMGRQGRSKGMKKLEESFKRNFQKSSGAKVDGVALGIAGDTAPNVLWRLLHGEMPDYFKPKVWWLSLGNNDLGRMECSEEVVVLGILRVVEEILDKQPSARIVINSIFPMTAVRGGLYPMRSDYRDSFNGRSLAATTGEVVPSTFDDSMRALLLRPKNEVIPQTPRKKPTTDEELAEAAEKEEEIREANTKRQEKHYYGRPRAKKNPIMKDATRIRKYRPETGFLRQSSKPLWTSIRAINKALRKFSEKHDRVTFFDATPIFARKEGKTYTLLTDKITLRGHPTELGFLLWEAEIVKKLEVILKKMKLDQPELFQQSSLNGDDDDDEHSVDIVQDGGSANEPLSADDDIDDALLQGNDDGFGVLTGNEGDRIPLGTVEDDDDGHHTAAGNHDDDDTL